MKVLNSLGSFICCLTMFDFAVSGSSNVHGNEDAAAEYKWG